MLSKISLPPRRAPERFRLLGKLVSKEETDLARFDIFQYIRFILYRLSSIVLENKADDF